MNGVHVLGHVADQAAGRGRPHRHWRTPPVGRLSLTKVVVRGRLLLHLPDYSAAVVLAPVVLLEPGTFCPFLVRPQQLVDVELASLVRPLVGGLFWAFGRNLEPSNNILFISILAKVLKYRYEV